jgi:AcrR family transcriptional regulator
MKGINFMITKPEEKKEDLRIRRTYKLLFEALIALLKERPFEKISVTDICERAMVHRTTFYKHFEDKYHLLQSGIKELQKDFNERSITSENCNNPQKYCMDIFRCTLQYFRDNYQMFTTIFANTENQTSSLIIMLYLLTTEDIAAKLEHFEKQGITKHSVPTPVMANFRAGALIALANWWIRNDMPISIDDMLKYVDAMITEY